MDYHFNGGEICPMTKGKDPTTAGCGLAQMRRWLHRWSWSASRKSTSVLKILARPILQYARSSGGTQLIHRVECPYGPFVEEETGRARLAHTIADVQARFAELNIACAKVLTIRAGR